MKITWAILSLAFVFGCKSNSFNAGSKQGIRPATATLQLPCGAGGQGVQAPVFQGVAGTMVRVSGELCSVVETKVSNANASIALVVDFSGSMEQNDPMVNGTCGRLQAVSALVNKMLQDSKGNGDIRIGVIHFGTTARVAIPFTDIKSFAGNLNAQNFCGYVDATNYYAALDSARELLLNAPGDKLLYFITDGVPTQPGNHEIGAQRGQDAADALRQAIPAVQLNVIMLKDRRNEALINPQQYLTSIAGGQANRVRIVENASDLAVQIVTFEVPKVQESTFDAKGIVAELSAGQFGSKKVQVESVVPVQGRAGVWMFTTAPIELFGQFKQRVENRLSLKSVTQPIPETAGTIIFELQ